MKLNIKNISAEEYHSLINIDKSTIYWLDNGTIYINGNLYGGKFEFIDSDPLKPELNTLYINLTSGEVKVYNGTRLITINSSSGPGPDIGNKLKNINSDGSFKYSLTIGDHKYNGTSDETIEVYKGESQTKVMAMTLVQNDKEDTMTKIATASTSGVKQMKTPILTMTLIKEEE